MELHKIVVLDVFWESEKNGFNLGDKPLNYLDETTYIWKDLANGSSYEATIKEQFWLYERGKLKDLLKSGAKAYLDLIGDAYKDTVIGLVTESMSTTVFLTTCSVCGCIVSATLNTYSRWGNLQCPKCNKHENALQTYGSLFDVRPDVSPYYLKSNKLPIYAVPMWKKTDINSTFDLKCPRCGKNIRKRLDSIESTGAYCQHCVQTLNKCDCGSSLRKMYPELAERFDLCDENTILSSDITCGSRMYGWFYCDGSKYGLKPHHFKKLIYEMVKAFEQGTSGCPICHGFIVEKGINDFETVLGDKVSAWDYELNSLNPSEVYYKSEKPYNFICPNGHKFSKDPNHMLRAVGTRTLGCPVCSGTIVIEGENDLESLRPDVMKYWNYELSYGVDPANITVGSRTTAWFNCVNCGEPYNSKIDVRCRTKGCCPNCNESGWSNKEKDLSAIIQSWGIEVEENAKIFGGRRSVDMYIPSKGIAVEFNGLYWHSGERVKDYNSHYKKYIDCKNMGIQLIYIWEDDYMYKRDIVLSLLKRRLGVSEELNVDAKDCYVGYINYDEAEIFTEKYHIQGSCQGSIYQVLKLKDSEEIVALCIYKVRGNGVYVLERYCTKYIISNGLSTLLKSLSDHISDLRGIEAFSDNCNSEDSLYESVGFSKMYDVKPSYAYFFKGRRKYSYKYNIDRFKTDPDLEYVDDMSEYDLAKLNKMSRVYDAGKVKWYKSFI